MDSNSDKKCIEWRQILMGDDTELIKIYIDSNDIHYSSEYPLRFACRHGLLNTVRLLIDKGVDVHVHDDAPIFFAAFGNHLEIVRLLITEGANVHVYHNHPLRYAAECGRKEMVKILIAAGANVNVSNDTIICTTALKGHAEIVGLLIDAGADINAKNNLPLRFAIRDSKDDVVRILIEKGADTEKLLLEETERMQWILKRNRVRCPRSTTELCLIHQVPINVGQEYYMCSNKSNHIYLKSAIDSWGRGCKCLLCLQPLEPTVYVNVSLTSSAST